MNLKNMKKMLCVLTLFLLALTFSYESFATNTVTTGESTMLELIENNNCTINVDNLAKLERKITRFNKEERSITVTLTLTNIRTVEQIQKPLEVFLVIDNSSSMVTNNINGITRKQAVINSANTLVNKLFAMNKDAKVGIVSFSSLDSTKGETEGTINDAQLVLGLSDSKADVQAAVQAIDETMQGPRTNIEAGITVASQNFSSNKDTNRYIILLTDGVPNNDINGSFATYTGNVADRTKAKLQNIESSGINIIGTMIGLDGEQVETQSKKTYKALAEEVFGTIDAPTISSYYYISDAEIETTIVEKIYSDIFTTIHYTLKDIIVKDYLTQEMVDNFKFEFVALPNIGKLADTKKVNSTDNSITWNIDELKEGDVATLSYKLTLKDDYDKDIIDKVLSTNTKLEITGNYNENEVKESSTISPKVKVLYKEDNTVAPKPIPQTGDSLGILFSSIAIISAIIVVSLLYMKKIK